MVEKNNIAPLIKTHVTEHGEDLSCWPVQVQDAVLQSLLDQEKTLPPPASDLLQARILKITHPTDPILKASPPSQVSKNIWSAIAATLVVSMATGMVLGQFLYPKSTSETEYMLADVYTDDFELILEVQ